MKNITIALIVAFIIAFLSAFVQSQAEEVTELSEQVVRLHILANSDSEQDQALKLLVRDAILKEVSNKLSASSRLEAEMQITEQLNEILEIAQRCVAENGYSYSVNCELVNMYFDEKQYSDITMPAGRYDALRIYIGNAEGQNWWCVMFPALCIAPSAELEESIECEFFTDEQLVILKSPQKVKYKFKCAELISWLGSFFGH